MKANFEKIIKHSNEPVMVLNRKWDFVFANKAALKFLGIKKIPAKSFWKEFPAVRNTDLEKCFRNAMNSRKHIAFEFEWPGLNRLNKYSIYAFEDGIVIFSMDITEKKVIEHNLEKAIEEKEKLIKEAHHRIKNNLQLILSLLNFQVKGISDKYIKNIFRDTQNRITAISILHKSLYQSSSFAFINVKTLLTDFIDSLEDSIPRDKNIRIIKQIDEIIVHSDLGVAISLIINELVTNSIKYAFKEKKSGKISIQLRDSGKNIILTEKDNGTGITDKTKIEKSDGVGLKVINALVEQNDGTFKYSFNNGCEFTIQFKKNSVTYKLK